MTPEERAGETLEGHWGYDPQTPGLKDAVIESIATAIREAVAAERKACYQIAFTHPATTKSALEIKAHIADAIACREFNQ